ncbi:MAG: sigma-70 family RNA polymerase sigma factor [Bacilli bacterium]|nr:sigma-70 family RNA polymerase sigma factor [Bacilli bacterium]
MEKIELRDLVVNNQNLIYSIASKFKGDLEDLFQVGCIGLINAYKNYDPSYPNKFTTYAYPYIYGEIYQYILKNRNIKISNDTIKLNSAINKAHDFLTQKYRREPTDLELSSFLEIPIYKIEETRNLMNISSLDEEYNEANLYNFIGFEDQNKDDLILLRDALEKLNAEERELIIKRYFYNMTQSEIAKQSGVNQVKVSREEGKVLTKLRSYM